MPARFLLPACILLALLSPTRGEESPPPGGVSFRNDVLPILSRAGCDSGSCHAKQGGQNGFQLTIFSYDPLADYREIVHNARGRRVFPAAPEQSLLLLKATQTIPHEGGRRIEPGSTAYQLLHEWIRQGMPYDLPGEPQLTGLAVEPSSGSYARDSSLALRVQASYSDGSLRDVTHLSHYQSPDEAIATVDEDGLVSIGRAPGEGVVTVRYMDQVEVARIAIPPATTLSPEAYAHLPVHNEIDRLAYQRHRELGLLLSDPSPDHEFLRRASLDTLGKLPSPERTRAFLADSAPDKRDRLIADLLADPDWAGFWAAKWRDLIVPNTQKVGVKPVYLLDRWIRLRLREDTPFDAFVRELLTAQGNTHEYGPVAILRDQRTPESLAAYVSRLFLGLRLDCAQCHHHPSEKWSQDDYFQMAAFFGSLKRKGQAISAPISGEPESWWFEPGGEVKHPVSGAVMTPKPPGGPAFPSLPPDRDPRDALAEWITSPQNALFSQAAVNRVWGEFFGRGIVHPVDDFRASNPPVNPALLDWLARDFAAHRFDLKHLMRRILQSNLYQASSLPNETNLADTKHFSRSYRRRLPAEAMLDAVASVTGVPDSFEGLHAGAPAMQTWNNKLNSEFLDTFGRPDSSADCPCERDLQPTMVQALHLMNSERLQSRLENKSGRPHTLAESSLAPAQITEELYLATYSRFPSPEELELALAAFAAKGASRPQVTEDLLWALLNSAEFIFNH